MSIEKSYDDFKSGRVSRSKLRSAVIEYVYKQVQRDRFIEAGDFIVDFIPKVDTIIEKFNPELASFVHYLSKHIKWLMFGFSRAYVKKKEKQEAYQSHQLAEYRETMCLMEEKAEYKISNDALKILSVSKGMITKESSKKRLEIFILKNSRLLNFEQINILAPLINRTPEWLIETKEKLDTLCIERVKNREYLQVRYNRLFIEITRAQKKLLAMDETYEKNLLFEKMQNKQKVKEKLNDKLMNRNCGPKNEEIANILDIPKGTVDSSLFYFKKALESLLPGMDLI